MIKLPYRLLDNGFRQVKKESTRVSEIDNPERKASPKESAGFDSKLETLQEEHTSAMIALVPAEPVAIEGGEPPDESHLTLFFLGEAAEIDDTLRKTMLDEMRTLAGGTPLIEANAFGAAVWNPFGEYPCVVMAIGGDGLEDLRFDVEDLIHGAIGVLDTAWEMPVNHTPWAPHVCLVYDDAPMQFMDQALGLVGPITFDRIRVAFGNEVYDFALGGGSDAVAHSP